MKNKRLKPLFPFFYSDFIRNTVIKIAAISFLKSKSLTHRKSKIILLQEPKKAAYQWYTASCLTKITIFYYINLLRFGGHHFFKQPIKKFFTGFWGFTSTQKNTDWMPCAPPCIEPAKTLGGCSRFSSASPTFVRGITLPNVSWTPMQYKYSRSKKWKSSHIPVLFLWF